MSKKRLHFIINPISGTGQNNDILKKIDTEIDLEVFEIQTHQTERPNHATKIAKKLCLEKADVVVAVGGDGTVNEVGKALTNSSCIMGIIPTGSGNGLARHLGIPQHVTKALRLINTLRAIKIDSCSANGHFFVNVSGIGYDGHISHCFSKEKKRGMKTYMKLILSEWWTYPLKKYQIEIDGITVFDDEAVQISFANGTQFGNNVEISPESQTDDGLMELCIVKPFNFYEIPFLLFGLATHRFHLSRRMKIFSCSEAVIRSSKAKTHLDGEPSELGDCLKLKVEPKSLNIITNKLV